MLSKVLCLGFRFKNVYSCRRIAPSCKHVRFESLEARAPSGLGLGCRVFCFAGIVLREVQLGKVVQEDPFRNSGNQSGSNW